MYVKSNTSNNVSNNEIELEGEYERHKKSVL